MLQSIVFSLALSLAAGQGAEDYRYGLESLQRGQHLAAIDAFKSAIAADPQPALAGSNEDLDYLPYLNLAVALHMAGQDQAARAMLEKSAAMGVVTRSYMGRNVWDRYAIAIMATDEQMLAATDAADYRTFDRSEPVLSDDEVGSIRDQVLRRCALTGKGPSDGMPWYFHYEFGLELMEAGDPQRALDELILAANLREDSKRNSRMYGMWFTNYLPYFKIAQAHTKLGNWQCAMDAMRVSARQSEFSPVDPGYEKYSDLQQLILRQTQG